MRRRLGGTRRIGGRRRGCASAAPVPSQVPALEPSWNPSQVRGTDRPREIPGTYEVEAGGIEPPSEGASASASTCVACVLLSPRSLPQAGSRAASRRLVSAPAPPALAGTQPEV